MKRFIGALLVGSSAILMGFQAEAQSRNWRSQTFTHSMDQKGSVTGDFTYSDVKVWSTNTTSPEIRFGCSKQLGLTANITFLPAAQADANGGQRLKNRQKTTTPTIDGREPERVPWTEIKETRTVQTRSGKHAAMIYNAVVQGLFITVKEPYEKLITIEPAPADDDFTLFAQNCPATSR